MKFHWAAQTLYWGCNSVARSLCIVTEISLKSCLYGRSSSNLSEAKCLHIRSLTKVLRSPGLWTWGNIYTIMCVCTHKCVYLFRRWFTVFSHSERSCGPNFLETYLAGVLARDSWHICHSVLRTSLLLCPYALHTSEQDKACALTQPCPGFAYWPDRMKWLLDSITKRISLGWLTWLSTQ